MYSSINNLPLNIEVYNEAHVFFSHWSLAQACCPDNISV
jgi:hypothetical protein